MQPTNAETEELNFIYSQDMNFDLLNLFFRKNPNMSLLGMTSRYDIFVL